MFTKSKKTKMLLIPSIALGCTLALSACASGSGSAQGGIPMPKLDQSLASSLPDSVKKSGTLKLATIQLPPYAYKGDDGTTLQGINVDTVEALKSLLGINVTLDVAPGVADIYTGFKSAKYDASIAPLSDIPSTQANYDFAVWLSEYVVFLQQKTVAKTAPVSSLTEACGHSIATIQGGTAQKVLETAQANCKTPIKIDLYANQDAAILAVKSGRAEAAFSSQIPLTYYTKQDDTLTLMGANSTNNGFPPFWVGAFTPKNDPLAKTLLQAMDAMKAAGTYDAILKKWGITANKMDKFGMNLAQ